MRINSLLALLLCGATFAGAAPKPNVLFIAVDDLRPELACYGESQIKSPNIDRLAKSGLLFERAYCQQAVCSPSRTSLMTGLRPDSTKVYDLDTNFRDTVPDVVTLSQHFMKHGYFSQGMGKIYHGSLNDKQSWSVPWVSRGKPPAPAARMVNGYFSEKNIQLLEREAKAMSVKRKALREKLGRQLSHSEGRNLRVRGPAYEAAEVDDAQTPDGSTACLAVRTMKELKKKDQPFFLAVGFVKPHLPFNAPQKYWDLYDPAKIAPPAVLDKPKGAPAWALANWGELRNYMGIPGGSDPLSKDLSRTLKHGYYACVSFMDAQVGLLLDALDELGLSENTIVILWGDHGWKLGEYGSWCKHSNVELDTRVPMMIRAPGKKGGQTTEALVEFVDIYPSLCELAGLPLPKHLEGTSFAPLLDDPGRAWKKAAFSQYPRSHSGKKMMGYALCTDRYRFVEWAPRWTKQNPVPDGVVELYDHKKDPLETENIAGDPKNERLVAKFRKMIRAGWKSAQPDA